MKDEEEARNNRSSFLVAELNTHRVLYLDEGIHRFFPNMRVGEPCYLGKGEKGPCQDCPLKRLEKNSVAAAYRYVLGLDVLALSLAGESDRVLIYYGKFGRNERQKWMENSRSQVILRRNRTVAFEFDPQTGEQFLSPFVSDFLSGNYDGRRLSLVFKADGVVHPDDETRMFAFRDKIVDTPGNDAIVLRLKNAEGKYCWYRICACGYYDDKLKRTVLVGTIADADEEIRLRENFRRQTEYDEVTGVYNKAVFYHRTEMQLDLDKELPHRVVVLDIDRFKMVNDLFGTGEGDRLLHFLGENIAGRMKGQETYGRLRDDVFGMCLKRSDAETVALIRELELALGTYPLAFRLTCSAGIYRAQAGEKAPVNILCDRALLAHKSVKSSAVRKYAFYLPEMAETVRREQGMIADMHRALEEGEFKAWYQPKNDLITGRVIGAEALVRWQHPARGIIPPGEFIPLFERNGLVTLLDEAVWESVCATLRRWMDAGFTVLPVSVNVSRVHLYDPELGDRLAELTKRYGIPPRLLEIELTESAYVENPCLQELMERLHHYGFTFVMDDFGSGYSSLNMLRSIPVDILKVDLHFLGSSDQDGPGKIIMKSVLKMAQELQIPVIVEGVETGEQAEFLKRIGATMAQGYLFARPMPVEEFESRYFPASF